MVSRQESPAAGLFQRLVQLRARDAQFAGQFSGAGSQFNQLTGVGNLAPIIAAQVPPQFQQFVPTIVDGIHEAMSLAR